MSGQDVAECIEAESLSEIDGLAHGFFTRRGGLSTGPFASLNCGLGSSDAPGHVRANRGRVAARLGASPHALVTARQVHSPRAITVTAPFAPGKAPEADAVVTNRPGLAVGVLTADCAPVLFADPLAGIAAAAHAGWRGALGGVLEATLAAMERLGAERTRIRAALGPCISQAHYEVSHTFRDDFLGEDRESEPFFHRPAPDARPRFDLPGYVLHRLARAGVAAVEDRAACTYAGESQFFSYRRACHRGEADYGRQISAILLK